MNTMYENAHVPLHKAFRAHAFFHEYGCHDVKSVARDIGVNHKTALRLADLMT